jgi:hypothetical protein
MSNLHFRHWPPFLGPSIVVVALLYSLVQLAIMPCMAVNSELQASASRLNSFLPIKVTPTTRWDQVIAGDNSLGYVYTLTPNLITPNRSSASMLSESQHLIDAGCGDSALRGYLENDVRVSFTLRDPLGVLVRVINLNKSDCNVL